MCAFAGNLQIRLRRSTRLHFYRQAYNEAMTTLNLKSLDPATLMPLPEVPESYGPRNEEDLRVYTLVKEAIDGGPGRKYDTVADFMGTLNARVSRSLSR